MRIHFSRITLFFFAFIMFLCEAKGQELSFYQTFGGYKFYRDVTEIPRKEFKSLLSEKPEAWELWRKSNVNTGVASGLAIASGGLLIWGLVEDSNSTDTPSALYWSAVGTAIASAIFSIISLDQRRNAVLTYNRDYVNSFIGPPDMPLQGLTFAYPIGR